MTFQIQPFGASYGAAATRQTVPDMTQTFVEGRKAREEQNRLLAQQEASQMMAAGDRQGAINRLLSVADPGEALRYQIALENQQAESARQGVLDQRYAAEQQQQTERYNAQQEHQAAMLKIQQDQEERARRADALKQPITLDQMSGGAGGYGGAAPLGASPAQPAAPPVTMAPDRPIAPPGIVSPQTGNLDTGVADVPLNPQNIPEFGMGGGRPGPSSAIAQAIQPPVQQAPVAAPQPAAPPPQGAPEQAAPAPARAMPEWLQKLDPDKQSRILALFDAGQATREEVNKIIAESPRQQTGQTGAVITAGQLRDDFTRDTDKYGLVKKAWSSVRAMAQDPTGAKDMGMLYEVVHAFDPGTAVMEGDKATAQNTTGVPDWVLNAYNNAVDGTFLTPTQRKNFVGAVGQIYNTAEDSYKETEQGYKDYADNYGVPRNQVIRDRIGKTPRFDPQNDPLYQGMPGGSQQQSGYQPGQGGAGIWAEFTKRLQQRLNRGAGPQQ